MMTLADKLRMLEEMRKIASGVRLLARPGICTNIAKGMTDGWWLKSCPMRRYFETIMARACKTWEHYSGDSEYPVGDPVGCPSSPYWAFDRLPRWEGEYGHRRYELCERIIKEIKRDLSKNHRSQRRSHQLGKKKRK